MISLLSALATIVALLLGWWLKNQATRIKENRNDQIQQGRTDIATGDVDAVSVRVDQAITDTGDIGRIEGGEDRNRSDRTLDRLVALGISSRPFTGTSGVLSGKEKSLTVQAKDGTI
jgi:hypothetical protein